MLSAINAPENRNETLKFFLEVILENKSDEDLYEVAVFNSNKHNDTTLTLLMKNYDVFRDTIGRVGNGFYRNLGEKTRNSNRHPYAVLCDLKFPLGPRTCQFGCCLP